MMEIMPGFRPQSGVTNTGHLGKVGSPVTPEGTSSAAKAAGPDGAQRQTGGIMQRISEFFKSIVSFFTGGGRSNPAELPAKTDGNLERNGARTSRFSVVDDKDVKPLGSLPGVFGTNKTPEEKQQQITDTVTQTIDTFAKSLRPESLPSEKDLDKLSQILESAQERLLQGANCDAQTTGLRLIADEKEDLAKLKELKSSQATATAAQSAYSESPTQANKESLLGAHGKLEAVQTSISQQSKIGKASSAIASNLIEKSKSFIKQAEAFDEGIKALSDPSSAIRIAVAKAAKEPDPARRSAELDKALDLPNLAPQDKALLKNIVDRQVKLQERISASPSMMENPKMGVLSGITSHGDHSPLAKAAEYVQEFKDAGTGIRRLTDSEAKAMMTDIVMSGFKSHHAAIDTVTPSKEGITALKGQVAKLDSKTIIRQLDTIGVDRSQIKGELLQKTCDAIGSNHNLSSLSSAEIKAEQTAVKTMDTTVEHSHGALKNLARMDHAAENIGTQHFDKLTAANKDLTLQIYQHGGLSETNGYDTAFMQKLGHCSDQFHSDKGLNDFVELAFKGDSQITQYQALRTIADAQLPPSPGRAESPIVAEHTLVALGQAAEKATLVKPGATEAQHRLHHATKALVGEINSEGRGASPLNSLASVKFTPETISAIKQHVTIQNVDHLLAQIITLQNKLLDGEALVPPRTESGKSEPLPVSQKTKDQLVACGLTTRENVDNFVKDAQLGVTSSKHFDQIVGRLEEFSKTISSNAALKDAFNNTFDNSLANALSGHDSILQARGADTGERTIGDRFTGATHKVGKETASALTGLRSAFSTHAQTTERAQTKVDRLIQIKEQIEILKDFALGQQVGGKPVTHEHLQLWQNKQMIGDELKLASQLSTLYPAGTSVSVDAETSRRVDAAIDQKLAFVGGEKGTFSTDANKFAKAGLMPGKVELYEDPSGTKKLRFVTLSRIDNGTIQSTVVGDLSKQQAERYLGNGTGSLQRADKTDSTTTEAVTSRAIKTRKSADDQDLNSFLASLQSKTPAPGGDGTETIGQQLTRAMEKMVKNPSVIERDIARVGLSAQREGVNSADSRTIQGALNKEIGKILTSVLQNARSALSNSATEDLVKDELKKPEIQRSIQQAVDRSLQEAGGTPSAATTALTKSLITQFSDDITGTLKSLASEVNITSSQKKEVAAQQAGVAFETAHASLTSVMSDMGAGASKSIGLTSFIQADAGGMVGMFDVSASIRGESEDKMTIKNNPEGGFSISLTQGKSVSGDVTGGFLSTLTASLGGSVGGEKGLTFNFETPSDAAGFLAAIKQGNAKLALAYTKDSPESTKAVEVGVRASAGFDAGAAIGLGGVLTASGAIDFNHKSEVSQGKHLGAPFYQTTVSTDRKYATEVAAMGTKIDSRSMQTSRSEIQLTSGDPKKPGETPGQVVLAYSAKETLSFTSNGNQLSSSGKSLGEERLAVIVKLADLDKIVAQSQRGSGVQLSDQAALSEFKAALQNFDPSTQKIVITETLKPDVLSRLHPTKDDARKAILSDPRNFTQTISIVSIDSSSAERSIGAKGITVGQTATGTSEDIVKSITIGQSLSIDRLKMAETVDGPNDISAQRTQSSKAIVSTPTEI